MCTNIRSVNANFDELLLYLENDINYKKIDILILTETWHSVENCVFTIPGYNTYYSSTKRNQNDGVIVFVKCDLPVILYEFGSVDSNILKLSLCINNTPLVFYCVYRSPASNTNDFIVNLRNIFDKENTDKGYNFLIGDMNINIIENINNDYLDMLAEHGYKSYINIYTRLPLKGNYSCLDHIFIKTQQSNLNLIEAGVIQSHITDHFSIFAAVPISNHVSSDNTLIKKSVNDLLCSLLSKENWSVLNSTLNINEQIDIFYAKLLKHIENSSYEIKLNSKNKFIKEWMTKGLLISARRKNDISKLVKKHPNNVNLRAYFIKYLNPQKDPANIANIFNSFFISVGKDLAVKFSNSLLNYDVEVPSCSFNQLFLKKIEKTEVQNIINNFKDKTAAGFDNISVKLLKHIVPYIVDPLIYILNICLEKGVFPEKFKLAIVKPLYKTGDKKNVTNYRPISMLCNFSKIFEKIIKVRLITFLEANELLSKNQFGFRPGRSTTGALYETSKFLYNELDNNKKVIAVFLDLAKAFDTVSHEELIKMLPCFGISNESLMWFKSYLKNRKQVVSINGVHSAEGEIDYGVPQGSVLGPLLFILYINNICNLRIDGQVVTYADDTCLLFSGNSWDDVHQKTTVGVNTVFKELNNNKLTLNIIWGGCSDNAIKPLVIQQNHAVRLCLGKKELYGSTSLNYKELRVLPVRYLYKQFSILFKAGKITIKNVNKREHRAYDLHTLFVNKQLIYLATSYA
ncbi:uncharacterized protein LOC111029296 [Myzus persicae]|uniref:uncharacterized protein LOC111029296 n=1 Tax=Myzus persicae TaxID=13164 RepID=UPI000B938F7F|nr:uncharacterized protein LOC111029296 [Myzus persicae]